jgi:hypothetical protein
MGTTLLHFIAGALRATWRALSLPARWPASVPASVSASVRALLKASLPVHRRNRLPAAVAVAGALIAAACGGDGLTSPATVENTARRFSVYALTGTSSALPSAYQYSTETVLRPTVLPSGSVSFDLAFDITADGKVRLLPVRTVVPSAPNGTPTVGILRVNQAFGEVGRAPDRGYVYDSVVVAAIGETFTLQLSNSGCVYQEPFYAKLTVDSILLPERRMVLRSLVNRNCGYRGLTEGLPKN